MPSVFGTEFQAPGIQRMGSVPDPAKDLVLHVALPILGGHVLHGTDAHESMGFVLLRHEVDDQLRGQGVGRSGGHRNLKRLVEPEIPD